MIARRRLLAVLAAGALALVGLAGCRSDPAVAAYVNDVQVTERQVDQVVESVRDLVPAERLGEIRRRVVTMLVLRAAGHEFAREEGIAVPAANPAVMADATGLPVDGEYTVLLAEFNAVLQALSERAEVTAPTEADQREAYANLQTNGQAVPPFDELRQYFSTETMGRSVGQRNVLNQVVDRADIVVNPKYGQLIYEVPVTIGQVPSWLGVPLTDRAAQPVADGGLAESR